MKVTRPLMALGMLITLSACTTLNTRTFADDMGADGYGKDAMDCVALAKSLVGMEGTPEAVAAGD